MKKRAVILYLFFSYFMSIMALGPELKTPAKRKNAVFLNTSGINDKFMTINYERRLISIPALVLSANAGIGSVYAYNLPFRTVMTELSLYSGRNSLMHIEAGMGRVYFTDDMNRRWRWDYVKLGLRYTARKGFLMRAFYSPAYYYDYIISKRPLIIQNFNVGLGYSF